ncbi:MAG TPA: S41 family peptidase [Mucilaginibacter sp.]|jgi:hypothetical protein|nr:S41 family peptidase [Mucilaginibacter sp.]
MKFKLVLIATIFFVDSVSAQVFDTVTYYKKYTPVQLHQDLDVLLKKFESIHPDYFKETPRDTVIKRYKQLKVRINKPLTRIDFMSMFAPVAYGVIKDGHNYVNAPEDDLQQYVDRGGTFFPLPVTIYHKKLFVNSIRAEIPYNSEIKSINGVLAQDIANTILSSYNPENDGYKESFLSGDFSKLYWFNYGIIKQFNIRYVDSVNTGVKQIAIAGRSLKQIDKLRSKPRQASKNYIIRYPNYAFYESPELDIGVLEYKVCDDLEHFRLFCDSVFTKIRKDQLKDLVIDIRGNVGGTTRLNEILYEYLTDKPIAQYSEIDVKISKEVKHDFVQANRKYVGWFKWYNYLYYPIYIRQDPKRKLLLTASNGTIVKQTFEPKKPKANELMFKGNIYLLTDNGTYSSAAIFAAAFKCYHLGTIVGQETGEPTCFTGDWVSIILPNTKLECAISDRRFILPCGDCDGRGVIPDYGVADDRNAMDSIKKLIIQNTTN